METQSIWLAVYINLNYLLLYHKQILIWYIIYFNANLKVIIFVHEILNSIVRLKVAFINFTLTSIRVKIY